MNSTWFPQPRQVLIKSSYAQVLICKLCLSATTTRVRFVSMKSSGLWHQCCGLPTRQMPSPWRMTPVQVRQQSLPVLAHICARAHTRTFTTNLHHRIPPCITLPSFAPHTSRQPPFTPHGRPCIRACQLRVHPGHWTRLARGGGTHGMLLASCRLAHTRLCDTLSFRCVSDSSRP